MPADPRVKKSIILCTDPRTGSGLLTDLMTATGVLGRPHEFFHPNALQLVYSDYPQHPREQLSYAFRVGTTPNGVFSIKLHSWLFDIASPHVDPGRDMPNPIFVFLFRNDALGQAISLVKAKQTGAWSSHIASKAESGYDGVAILHALREVTARRARWETWFARNGIAPLRMEYEEIAANPEAAVHSVAARAGVENVSIPTDRTQVRTRQANKMNDEWRERFLKEYRKTQVFDRFGML